MRLFAAIDTESQVQDRIKYVQQHLKRELHLSGKEIKWVRPEQTHLTLKFLGEVPNSTIMPLCDVMTRTAAEYESFELRIQGLGVFGRPARVVWAGCEIPTELLNIQARLENEFEQIGWDKENRPFAGHLTIGRVKSAAAGHRLARAIQAYSDEYFGSVSVDQLCLYESQLSRTGPEYSAVCTASLK
ncbi:MAG: RNA 2',3'-cyclic phosphodiesterase [Planctomycetota bacterium]|nr:MAG: RNA 2',3'-cyclic phosphodiesterase [Planctomycetota bacterium]